MNSLRKYLEDKDYKIKSYKIIKSARIIETDKCKLVYKENTNNYDTYDYLKTRDFNFFPNVLSDKNSNFELTEYIDNKDIPREQKLNDLIHLSGILHRKTSFNKEIDIDDIKSMYESIVNEIDYLMKYYNDLNNYIDTVVFMSPSEYLLVSNIDIIYFLLNFSRFEIDNWYKYIREKKVIRYSVIHNNLSLDNLLENDYKYLISWSKSRQDMPILDLARIYEENYFDLSLEDLLREYEIENRLDYYEYLFFLIKIAIPKRIEFTKNTYLDCYNINKYIVYLRKIAELIQKNKGKKQKN